MKTYEFEFVFIGEGKDRHEALADAIQSVRLALDSNSLEPNYSKLLDEGN